MMIVVVEIVCKTDYLSAHLLSKLLFFFVIFQLWLLDFGAARYYPKTFVDQYIEIVKGAAAGDRISVLDISRSMGFLTGYESKVNFIANCVFYVLILNQ